MRGSPLGFGIETQARDAAAGLNSARGRIFTWLGAAIVFGRARNLLVTRRWRRNREFVDVEGHFLFLGRGAIRLSEIGARTPILSKRGANASSAFLLTLLL